MLLSSSDLCTREGVKEGERGGCLFVSQLCFSLVVKKKTHNDNEATGRHNCQQHRCREPRDREGRRRPSLSKSSTRHYTIEELFEAAAAAVGTALRPLAFVCLFE